MWGWLNNVGGALKRPFAELPKAKMPDIGAIKPQLAGGGSVGPQGPAPIPTNDTQLGGKVQYNGPQRPDFVPNLGRPGPVRQPWSEEGAARNDWIMQRAQRTPGAPGTVLGRDAETGQEYAGGQWTGGIKRDWKDMLSNAMLGYSQAYQGSGGNAWAGLGGAMAGGGATAINPMAGRNYSFDQAVRPQMIEDQTRQAEQDRLRMEGEMQRARIGEIQARTAESAASLPVEMDYKKAQAEALRANASVKDPQLQAEFTRSRIALNTARAEAARTGRVQTEKIYNPQTDTYEIVAIHPDGTVSPAPIGMPADAQMNKENIQSREKVAADRNATGIRRTAMAQAGATGRTVISQKGQDQRLQTRLGAEGAATAAPSGGGASGGGKVATPELLQRYISEKRKDGKHITLEQAKKTAREAGYQVQ